MFEDVEAWLREQEAGEKVLSIDPRVRDTRPEIRDREGTTEQAARLDWLRLQS